MLLEKYCKDNPDHIVSKGMFMKLKPFYIRNVSLKDMEMCCCKLHLHIRCTPGKKTLCGHIQQQWNDLTKYLASADDKITVPFTHFEKRESFNSSGEVIKNKKGEPVKRLVSVKEDVSALYLVNFLSSQLPNIIHHHNMLRLPKHQVSVYRQP